MGTDNLLDIKEFAKFEEQERLFDREYAGIPYWQELRLSLCRFLVTDRTEEKTVAVKNRVSIYQRAKNLVYCGVKGIKGEFALKKRTDTDVILYRLHIGSHRFYDYWEMPEGISAIQITPSRAIEKNPPSGTIYLGLPDVVSTITYRVQKILHRTINDEKEFQFLKKLEHKIICRFGKCMTAEQMQESVQVYCNSRRIFQGYYSRFFDRLKPRAIVIAAYDCSIFHPVLNEAKKRGIKIIELQHCLISNDYEYWFEDQRGTNNQTPDYMLLFGRIHETWAKLLKSTTCVSVGFPFQEHELKRFEDCEPDKKTVIVYPTSDKRFETVISEFVDRAEPLGYKVIVKVHPGAESNYLEVYYPLLSTKSNLEIITGQSKSIYYWIKRGKHHVMANTTVGFEVAAVEGSNICIALNVNHGMMQPLLDMGVARGFKTADELLELVLNPKEMDMSHKRELWEENAKENMERFFRQMQEQGWPDGVNYRQ